jgi:hypothetical protein
MHTVCIDQIIVILVGNYEKNQNKTGSVPTRNSGENVTVSQMLEAIPH